MVPMTAAVVLAQGAALQAQLDRIAWAQMVMAICMAVVTLALLGAVVAAFMLVRSVRRQVKALAPRAEPLLSAANKVAADATDLSGAVKERAEEVLKTVQDLNGRLRELATETEGRVREFGAVLDVVQDEAREILLDAASTARGVHTTAEALQSARNLPVRRRKDVPDQR